MNKIEGNIFDENGTLINIDNVDIFVSEMKDRLLVNTYKSTIYQHTLTEEMEKLLAKGLVKTSDYLARYNPTLAVNAIRCMKLEIIERFDKKFHGEVVKTIDLSFLENKPKNI